MTQAGQAGQAVEETFKRFGSLINFSVLLIGFLAMFITAGSWKTTVENGIAESKRWQEDHMSYHRDRLAETKEIQGAVNARLGKQDDLQQQDARKLDTLEQRVTSLEKGLNTVEQNAAMTNRSLNDISGKLQVVQEILSRIEKKQGG